MRVGVKGKLILSLNDTPGVRESFSSFRIEAVKTFAGQAEFEAATAEPKPLKCLKYILAAKCWPSTDL